MDRTKWEYVKLGDICTSITDGSHNPPKGIEHSDYRMISSQNIYDDELRITDESVRFLTEDNHYKEDKRTKLSEGVVLLTIVGTIGRACVLKGKEGFLTLQRSVAALHLSSEIQSRFLMYCLIGSRGKLEQEAHGIAQRGIYLKQLSELKVPLPNLAIQQSIISELDKLNEVIALKRKQLADLDSLAQSIFYELFGDPVVNEKGWSLQKLETICTHIVDCPHSTPKKADKITPYPCIRTSELKGGNISWDTMQYLEKDEYDVRIARLKPEAGDIVFGREGTIGDAVILPKGYFFSLGQRTMLLRTNESMVTNTFLHRVILSEWVKKQIRSVNVSSTVAHVNIKDFKLFDIPLPPLPLQKSFATKIAKIEAEKQRVKSSLKDLETLLASRMQYWFDN